MALDPQMEKLMAAFRKTTYFKWMGEEGLPIVEGHGVEDVRGLNVVPWKRTGGKGCFINLYGMEGVTGMYLAEIPAGGSLEPEKHLYEEVICILDGQGATEIWQDGGEKRMFEWGKSSLFVPPVNTWHRLINGGRDPVRFLAVTNAPLLMDVFHNPNFLFDCPYKFSDRYRGEEDYFAMGKKRYELGMQHIWETNFIADLQSASLDTRAQKGAGVQITQFEASGNGLIGHLSEWPEGRYHKAHFHGPGAILLGLQSSGYVLLWPKEAGQQPWVNGHGDQVTQVSWREGSVYCPPSGWYHQHFNTGPSQARHLAVRTGSRLNIWGFTLPAKRQEDGVYLTSKQGGTLIDY
ncbi:MAG: cupin domain-containing protein, partial [Deltaproteobacteria bacterium]|nr:cupin domain-containing protein [Deltaproteobacteria bacterium]